MNYKYSRNTGSVRLPPRGGKLGGMKIMQEVLNSELRDIARRLQEISNAAPFLKKASAPPKLFEFLAEQWGPTPEEVKRFGEEKKRPDKPTPKEPGPAPEPEPEPNPEEPKK